MEKTILDCAFTLRMAELGLSNAQAAVNCGCSVSGIDKWRRASAGIIDKTTGRIWRLPTGDNMRRIELALDCDARYLFPFHYPEYKGKYPSAKNRFHLDSE